MVYPSGPAWQLLERTVDRCPDRIAIREIDHETLEERRHLSYAELFRAIGGAASGLMAAGIAPDMRIGVALPNSATLIIAYYAVWCTGAITVPVNPFSPAADIVGQLRDADVSFIIGEPCTAAADAAAQLDVRFIDSASFAAMERTQPIPCVPRRSSDLAVLLYTGGTTGHRRASCCHTATSWSRRFSSATGMNSFRLMKS
jgi:acyl-CoA synthetase (AMP-forming)/AMP-acid ligase II